MSNTQVLNKQIGDEDDKKKTKKGHYYSRKCPHGWDGGIFY